MITTENKKTKNKNNNKRKDNERIPSQTEECFIVHTEKKKKKNLRKINTRYNFWKQSTRGL